MRTIRPHYAITPTIDLSTIPEPTEVVGRGVAVSVVSIRSLVIGAAPLLIHFGTNRDGIPVMSPGEEFRFPVPCDSGVYVSCPGGAADQSAVLMIVFPDDG